MRNIPKFPIKNGVFHGWQITFVTKTHEMPVVKKKRLSKYMYFKNKHWYGDKQMYMVK
jgi:hypothetical protein